MFNINASFWLHALLVINLTRFARCNETRSVEYGEKRHKRDLSKYKNDPENIFIETILMMKEIKYNSDIQKLVSVEKFQEKVKNFKKPYGNRIDNWNELKIPKENENSYVKSYTMLLEDASEFVKNIKSEPTYEPFLDVCEKALTKIIDKRQKAHDRKKNGGTSSDKSGQTIEERKTLDASHLKVIDDFTTIKNNFNSRYKGPERPKYITDADGFITPQSEKNTNIFYEYKRLIEKPATSDSQQIIDALSAIRQTDTQIQNGYTKIDNQNSKGIKSPQISDGSHLNTLLINKRNKKPKNSKAPR